MGSMKDALGDRLFQTEAYARAHDKETSHAAAESVKTTYLEGFVLRIIKAGPPSGMTKDDVHGVSQRLGHKHERDSIGPRFATLERKGLILPLGERKAKSGRMQTVYIDRYCAFRTRSVPEWVGATADTRIPDRVKLRVFLSGWGRCYLCNRKVGEGTRWHCDHVVPLILGGENREYNLLPICEWCHTGKTKSEVAEKAITYRKRKASLGLKRSKNPMPGSRSSKWKKKMDGTIILRSRS